jgi:hypothetical protein
MSCITEILNKKGDSEILPVERDGFHREVVIEGGGHYKGFEYLITFTDNGFRCGYVAVPEGHPAFKDNGIDYPEFSVHGGITFFEESHLAEAILGHTCTDKWLGFDAGHGGDMMDGEAAIKYFPNLRPIQKQHIEEMNRILGMAHHYPSAVRTKNYMEKECKSLIEQLINIKEAA